MQEVLKRKYIIKWIMDNIVCECEEDFKIRWRGSSDRKWYDAIIRMRYLWELYTSMFKVQPRDIDVESMVEKQKARAIQDTANAIYEKLFT